MASFTVNPIASDSYYSIEGQSRLTSFEAIYLLELALALIKRGASSSEEIPSRYEIAGHLKSLEDMHPNWHFYDYEICIKNMYEKESK